MVGVGLMRSSDVVANAKIVSHLLEQPRAHPSPQDGGKKAHRGAILVIEIEGSNAKREVHLIGFFKLYRDLRSLLLLLYACFAVLFAVMHGHEGAGNLLLHNTFVHIT